jgi:hypothetical protein
MHLMLSSACRQIHYLGERCFSQFTVCVERVSYHLPRLFGGRVCEASYRGGVAR